MVLIHHKFYKLLEYFIVKKFALYFLTALLLGMGSLVLGLYHFEVPPFSAIAALILGYLFSLGFLKTPVGEIN